MTLHELLKNIINKLKTTIKTTPQSLTDEEKHWARQNIDAVSINEIAQADWEQNDSSALDYIKNKTHWTESKFEVIAEQTVSFDSDRMGNMTTTSGLVAGDTYKVTINSSMEYIFEAREFMLEGRKACCIGDINGVEGFVISSVSGLNSILLIQAKNYGTGLDIGQWPMKIEHFVEETHKLDPKFLPEDGFGYVETQVEVLSEITFVNEHLDVNAPEGSSTFITLPQKPKLGKEYIATFDGVKYRCVCAYDDYEDAIYLGNVTMGSDSYKEAEPFCYWYREDDYELIYSFNGEHTFSIGVETENIHPIDTKFLPEGGFGYVGSGEPIDVAWVVEGEQEGTYTIWVAQEEMPLVEGDTYEVTTDSGVYSTVCKVIGMDGVRAHVLGNVGLIVGDESLVTDDTFIVLSGTPEGQSMTVALDLNVGSTLVVREGEVIHKIDPKYLPEGIGYTEVGKELASFELDDGIYEGETPIGLVEGKTYIIKTDVVTYEGVCKCHKNETAEFPYPIRYIGNGYIFGFPDTGEEYVVAEMCDENGSTLGSAIACEGSQCTITSKVEIHTIDGKYLPKGGVGYTEDGVLTHDGNYNGKVTFTESAYRYVRVGDRINFDDIVKVVVYYEGEQRVVLREYMETIEDENGNIAITVAGMVGFYILTDTNPYNMSSGTYVVSNKEEFSLYIMQIETETVHVIEDKYIPDTIARKSDIPSTAGLATESYVDNKISAIPTPDVSGQIANHNSSTFAHGDIRNAINGKANSSHTHTASDLQGLGYLSSHPELNGTVIPFIYNDLAFLTLKGGSVRMYKTTSTDYTAIQLSEQSIGYDSLSKLFDGTPSYTCLSGLDSQTYVVIDMDLGRGYPWSNKFYIDFGNNNWAPENLKLYARNPSLDSAYVFKDGYSNGRKNNWTCNLSHLDEKGFTQIRLVLNGFYAENGTVGRIAQIGLINYGSSGVKEIFISRGGCEGIYGNLLPNKNSDINLGSGDKRWNTIYVDEIVGAIPTVTASDSGKFLRVSANGSWVAETVPQIEEVAF